MAARRYGFSRFSLTFDKEDGNLQSLKVIRPKRAKIFLHKVAKFHRRLKGGVVGGG